MTPISSSLSMITLNVKRFNSPIKAHREVECIKSKYMLSTKTQFRFRATHTIRDRKRYSIKTVINRDRADVAILILNIIAFSQKTLMGIPLNGGMIETPEKLP